MLSKRDWGMGTKWSPMGGEPLENCNVVPQHNWAQNPAYAQWGGQAELAIIRLHKQIGLKTLDNGGLAHLNIMLGGPQAHHMVQFQDQTLVLALQNPKAQHMQLHDLVVVTFLLRHFHNMLSSVASTYKRRRGMFTVSDTCTWSCRNLSLHTTSRIKYSNSQMGRKKGI